MGNKYKKNYLSQVIARIDFLSPLSSLQEDLPAAVGTSAASLFPIPEPKEIVVHKLQIIPETKQGNEKDINPTRSNEIRSISGGTSTVGPQHTNTDKTRTHTLFLNIMLLLGTTIP